MAPQTLRPYQQDGIKRIMAAYSAGARRVLAVAPTGSGKTSIYSYLIAQMQAPALVLVHRRELASQGANRLREFGVPFGYIMAGERPNPCARVQIASVQTLVKRLGRAPPARLVICDEAHLSTAKKTWAAVLECYPKALILGLTATPWRMLGTPLVGAYDDCVVVSTPRELREQGFLSAYNGFSYLTPDLSAVATVGGEYNEKQSSDAMREPQIVANIVEKWLAHASTLSTIVFAVTVEHSQQLCAEFKAAGVSAEHIDGGTPLAQREAILARVASGVTRVLCNVGIAVEGLDIPRVKCIVLARPTKSLARAIQMMGRGRRPFEGLTCRIHDHAFNIKLHGLPDADRDYTLSAKPVDLPSLTQCETCLAMYQGRACTACGGENEAAIRGERELATVADAEQFDFSSEDAAADAKRPMVLPAVRVDWGDKSIGRIIEGVFERTWVEATQYGPTKQYLLKGTDGKRDYTFPGTQQLNAKMARVAVGALVQVTYKGLVAGGRAKDFGVSVDDGKDAKKEQARVMYEGGKSQREVGEALGVGETTIHEWGHAGGWKMRNWREANAPDPVVVAQARAMYESGKFLAEVGEALGVSTAAIHRWGHAGGWKMRNRTLRAQAADV